MPHPALLRGKRVLVFGLGAFGGGVGCARALSRLGAEVTATDLREAAELPEAVEALRGYPVRLVLGGHDAQLFRAADWVVVNPAVPENSSWLEIARGHGCGITTEVNLAVALAPSVPALAITGTHGKSTMAALATHLLREFIPTVALGGNFGGSLLESVAELSPRDRLVVELSSYQTARLESERPWPRVAALTVQGSDHLEWHGGLEAYRDAKLRLLAFQDDSGLALLPDGDPAAERWENAARGRVLWFSAGALSPQREGWEIRDGTLMERREGQSFALAGESAFPFRERFRLPGLVAAVAGARLLGLPPDRVEQGLKTFQGLPHRMEALSSPPGTTYLDNAVATHPEPTLAALRSLDGPVVLVAGGKDKGLPLEDLAAAVRKCHAAHLFGEGGRRLAAICAGGTAAVILYDEARRAVEGSLAQLEPGETLLFSPSFSSYDEYRNFQDRAKMFRELCRKQAVNVDRSACDAAGENH